MNFCWCHTEIQGKFHLLFMAASLNHLRSQLFFKISIYGQLNINRNLNMKHWIIRNSKIITHEQLYIPMVSTYTHTRTHTITHTTCLNNVQRPVIKFAKPLIICGLSDYIWWDFDLLFSFLHFIFWIVYNVQRVYFRVVASV